MIAIMLLSIFTIEIGDTPTLAFEAQNLREAHELCQEQWLKTDLAEAESNGVPLWDGRPNCEQGWHRPTRVRCLPRPKILVSRLTG
jgi:hypothetical protein